MLDAPLYRNVADKIESRVQSGLYEPGTPLPTETVLEQEFSVSRITIRQALGLLKRRGILVSRSGLGTFVRPGAMERDGVRFTGSLSELVYYATTTRYVPLQREFVPPPRDVAELLELKRREKVYCFSGKRGWHKGDDFCFEQIYVPEQYGHELDNGIIGSSPLFVQLENLNHVKITDVTQTITAVTAGSGVARALAIKPRQAVLKATRIYRIEGRGIAEVAVSHYDPARFQYSMNLFLE